MKILHLADLHLGKILQEQSFLEDQKYMLNKIIEKIKEENIETILISGDIYDRSIPPTEAVDLLDEFLNVLIRELKRKVFIIAGNHDSKERLGFGNKIFEQEGLYIGVPAIINKNGVKEILKLKLSKEDQAKFDHSCDIMKENIKNEIDPMLKQ